MEKIIKIIIIIEYDCDFLIKKIIIVYYICKLFISKKTIALVSKKLAFVSV